MPSGPILTGRHVVLEPLMQDHVDALWKVADDPRIWRYTTASVPSRDALATWVAERLVPVLQGTAFAFCQHDAATRRPVGATSLFGIDTRNRRAEIGFTWLAPGWWGTAINTEAKRLLLGHAFDALGLERVQIKTDARNLRAQRAIERLGAVREGTLRRHDVLPDGHVRDVALYSVVRTEWPAMDSRLASLADVRHAHRPHGASAGSGAVSYR